jgi:hypothetical protein
MADWQRTLRLQPEWNQAANDEITVQQCAKVIAERLRALEPFGETVKRTARNVDQEREAIAEQLEALAEDEEATTEHFDYVMDMLYDWADQRLDDRWNGKKVYWVDGFNASH